MEDERIARVILSALLQKDVVAVQIRRNEYSNIASDGLSVFRIDFGVSGRHVAQFHCCQPAFGHRRN